MSSNISEKPRFVTSTLNDNISKTSDLKNEGVKTAKKINYWALFGLTFLVLGVIATTIATCGLNLTFVPVSVATLDIVLGYGVISLFLGAISITKALIDRKSPIFNPKEFGLSGIENNGTNTCWLNSLMQMLMNSPDLKRSLRNNVHFKEFIDNYEKAIKENTPVDTLKLKNFLKTICTDITDANNFYDSHEVLLSILNLVQDSNKNLQNALIEKKHFSHQDAPNTFSEQKNPNNGLIELSSPKKTKETIYRLLNDYFTSKESLEVNDTICVKSTKKEKYLFGFFERDVNVTEDVIKGKKQLFLQESKLQFPPEDLFLDIKRYEYDLEANNIKSLNNPLDVPFIFKLDKKYVSTNQNTQYELSSFIRHVKNNHYISYVKKDRYWFECNDNNVKHISFDEAKRKAETAYLIHYNKLR